MKIKYVTIIVDDMDKSAEFYTKVLGFEVEEVFTRRKNCPAWQWE